MVAAMKAADGLLRARRDLKAERMWKARDRLHGLFSADPSNQEVLELLGEVYFRMGDLPQAGRYWYLTERGGEDAEVARQAFQERFGATVFSTAESLPVGAALDAYPTEVQERLRALIADLKKSGGGAPYGWLAHGMNTRWVTGETPGRRPSSEPARRPPPPLRRIADYLAVGALVVFTVGIWLVGLVAFLWFIGSRLLR